jgi:two-component system CheB/CheR fusion protein
MSSEPAPDAAFERLLEYLRSNRGFDFTEYKRASLVRRVRKRMGEVGIADFEEYQDYLEVHPQEFTELFNTILINVTSFFRDKPAWDYIADEIVPRILEAKTPNATLRIWSAGCASGEEAYSIAMILAEALGLETFRRQVKIYATDVDEEELEQARRGSYGEQAIADVPEDLQERYFDIANHNDRHAFRQDLRRALIFGRHDLMHDAPISRLDALLCRNTLIYFNREAQERIVARFHFALKDTGYVFLGRAETMLSHDNLFEAVNLKHRIFGKVSQARPSERVHALMRASEDIQVEDVHSRHRLERAVYETWSAASLVVDDQGNLALANEEARRRLGIDPRDLGRPFHYLEISYRPLELRSLIERARDERQSIVVEEAERAVANQDEDEIVDVTVIPLWGAGDGWLGTSIVFRDVSERQELRQKMQQTRHELETAYEELQSTNEELETSNEELQSTVEELQTTNEELQSSNEEMETMNEELQSANAELQAMNEQLHNRTRDLDRANSFLESVLASVDVGVVAIDRKFNITLWNQRAEDLWGLRSEEVVGLSFLDLDIGLPVAELEGPVERFLAGEERQEVVLEALNRRGRNVRCYVTQTIRLGIDGEPAGVVLLMEEEVA